MRKGKGPSKGAAIGMVFLAVLCWSLIGPLSTVLYALGGKAEDLAAWRALFGLAFFGTQAFLTHSWKVSLRDLPLLILFGLAGVGGLFTFYGLAIQHGGTALAVILLYTAPAWVTLGSFLFFKERPRPLPLFLVTTGVLLVSLGGGSTGGSGKVFLGIFYGVLSGLTFSFHFLIGKLLSPKYPPATVYAWAFGVGLLILLPRASINPRLYQEGLLPLIALGFFTGYGGYFIYILGLRALPASQAALVASSEPLLATLLAFIFFGESLSPLSLLGGGTILTALFLSLLRKQPSLN